MMRMSATLRTHRWLVFAGWLLALVPAVGLLLTGSNQLTGGGFEVSGSQSLHVQRTIEDHFPDEGASPLALVAAPRANATYADMTAAVAELERVAREAPNVTITPNPTQPPPQPDRPYVVSLRLDFNNTGAVDVARQLRQAIGVTGSEPGEHASGTVRLYVIGQGALGAAAQTSTKHDIAAAERWNLPIVLIVLIAVFGSLAAAAVPLILGICTVTVTMGVVYLLSQLTTMSVFVSSTVSMFGIALAVDYSLFILMRYREELRQGRTVPQATDAAMATSGLAVVLSGLTVIASLTGIYLIDTPVLASMATGAILAVVLSVLTSVTMTPAILATFGRSAARRSPLLQLSRRRGESEAMPFWSVWVRRVMRRPWLSALLATLALLLAAAPAFSMVLGNSMLRQFPASHEIRGGVNAAAEALGPGALGPVRVLLEFPDGIASAPDHAPLVDAVAAEMDRAINIVTVSPPVYGNDDHSVLLSGVLSVDPEDLAARRTVDWLRVQLPRVLAGGTGAH
ncbi:MAG TPA: MMPL family transporter, partial [Mycobacterium sp.]|nr:MMPL family transporter [Mycobacterium sp.]